MKKITWEDFKTGNVIIHCDTKEKALHFITQCSEREIHWDRNTVIKNPYETFWEKYEEDTCYRYNTFTGRLLYSPLSFYETMARYDIHTYEIDLIQDEIEETICDKITNDLSYDDNLKNVRREYFTENPSCKGCLFGKESLTGIMGETSCEVKFRTVKNADAESCKYYKIKF